MMSRKEEVQKFKSQIDTIWSEIVDLRSEKAEAEKINYNQEGEDALKAKDILKLDDNGNRIIGKGGLYEELEKLEEENKNISKSVDDARKSTPMDPNSDIDKVFEVNVDGKQIRTPGKGTQLTNLLRLFSLHLSNFNNPFLDTYTDSEKSELVSGIIGKPAPTDDGSGNTVHSFSWFKKWWEHFKKYNEDCSFFAAEPKDFDAEKDIYLDNYRNSSGFTLTLRYRDTAKMIRDLKEKAKTDSSFSRENLAKKYLYIDSSSKWKVAIPEPVYSQYPSEVGPLDKDAYFFSPADFMFLFSSAFPESTRSTNPLLNRGTTSKDYTLETVGPGWMKGVEFNIGLPIWYELKSGRNSYLNKDHDEHIWKTFREIRHKNLGPDFKIEDNPLMLKLAPGIKGFVDKFHDFFKPHIQQRFISKLYYLRSVKKNDIVEIGGTKITNPSSDSNYLVAGKYISIGFNPGEIKSFNDLSDIKTRIKEWEEKWKNGKDFLNIKNKRVEEIQKQIDLKLQLRAKLIQNNKELAAEWIQELEGSIEALHTYISVDVEDSGKAKKTEKRRAWSWLRDYGSKFKEFESAKQILNQKIDDKYSKAYKKWEKMKAQVDKTNGFIFELVESRGDKKMDDFIKEICQDKTKSQKLMTLLESLSELKSYVHFDERQELFFKELEKSPIVGRDMKSYLGILFTGSDGKIDETKVSDVYISWKKNSFGKKYVNGHDFYALTSKYKDNKDFENFLRDVEEKTGDKKLADLLYDERNNPRVVIRIIRRYEIHNWMKGSPSIRKEKPSQEQANMLVIFREYASIVTDDGFEGVDNKGSFKEQTAESWKEEFKRLKEGVNKELSSALGLEVNDPKVSEWNGLTGYNNAESIKNLTAGAKAGGLDITKTIKENSPKDAAAIFIRFDIEKVGLKSESDIEKTTDKGKIETLIAKYTELENIGVIDEEEKKKKTLCESRKGQLDKKKEDKVPDKVNEDKSTEEKSDDKTQAPDSTKKPDESFLSKHKYWIIAGSIIVAAGLGFAAWYFFFKDKGDSDSNDVEE